MTNVFRVHLSKVFFMRLALLQQVSNLRSLAPNYWNIRAEKQISLLFSFVFYIFFLAYLNFLLKGILYCSILLYWNIKTC
jgi:hypothetical protein